MINWQTLTWPVPEGSSLPFIPTKFALIPWEKHIDFKIAVDEGTATRELICRASDLDVAFYRFDECEYLQHQRELLVFEVTDGLSIVMSQ